jgi:hypothetical protein
MTTLLITINIIHKRSVHRTMTHKHQSKISNVPVKMMLKINYFIKKLSINNVNGIIRTVVEQYM